MAAAEREDVYATLLLNDSYLPGALVLAHSLRDAGTSKKLAVLVTMESLSTDSMTELGKLYDYIVPVERIVNDTPANLHLMNRLDLGATFTKITLWRQEQFRRIVYIDADVVALRAPDELFDLPHPFSAAPDIGWPDLFNSGVMVLDPNMGDYYALLAMAQRGISFDGADQGLLNMHFKNSYHRLSFTYNVTPSGHYQYVPAFRHFQSAINMVHFIGSEKPWTQGREANKGGGPYNELLGRWWAVYDRHYRVSSAAQNPHSVPQFIQKYVKGEYIPITQNYSGFLSSDPEGANPAIVIESPARDWEGSFREQSELASQSQSQTQSEFSDPPQSEHQDQAEASTFEYHEDKKEMSSQAESQPAAEPFHVEYTAWDASKAPPPTNSKPEASNFPSMVYTMSSDPKPFKAPEKYPDPPKDMYYEVPKAPTYQKPAPIFPWESSAAKPSRVFAEDLVNDAKPKKTVSEGRKPAVTKAAATAETVDTTESWGSPSRANAWDELPQIENYIRKNRKGNLQILQGQGFGSELERPSLPVTPAPIRRPSFWGTERDEAGELPAAEGVPAQADWDPTAQLEMLAQHQAHILSLRLDNKETAREIPSRPLPYGSEGVISPTYLAHAASMSSNAHHTSHANIAPSACSQVVPPSFHIEEPSYNGPGAAWEKDESYPQRETPLEPSEEEKDVLMT